MHTKAKYILVIVDNIANVLTGMEVYGFWQETKKSIKKLYMGIGTTT